MYVAGTIPAAGGSVRSMMREDSGREATSLREAMDSLLHESVVRHTD
jgi:hypothetical protein